MGQAFVVGPANDPEAPSSNGEAGQRKGGKVGLCYFMSSVLKLLEVRTTANMVTPLRDAAHQIKTSMAGGSSDTTLPCRR